MLFFTTNTTPHRYHRRWIIVPRGHVWQHKYMDLCRYPFLYAIRCRIFRMFLLNGVEMGRRKCLFTFTIFCQPFISWVKIFRSIEFPSQIGFHIFFFAHLPPLLRLRSRMKATTTWTVSHTYACSNQTASFFPHHLVEFIDGSMRQTIFLFYGWHSTGTPTGYTSRHIPKMHKASIYKRNSRWHAHAPWKCGYHRYRIRLHQKKKKTSSLAAADE